MKNLKRDKENNKGFTIIEVLIVLAIAGLIMLVVFLAVPALQRNARNTQRKSDVSAMLAAVNEYTANNAGKLPSTNVEKTAAFSNAKLGYYTSGEGTAAGQVGWLAGAQAAPAPTPANDRIIIVTSAKCGTAGATIGGSARQIALQYQLETSGNPMPTCQES